MTNITPFLWFEDKAEEAANFYVSVFPNSKITGMARYDENAAKAAGRQAGSVLTVAFELDGNQFTALNGGPAFKFSPAISFVVPCATQAEVDHYWQKLGEDGGRPGQCGWLDDKFGVSWQIVPAALASMVSSPDKEKSKRVVQAMLKMTKLDVGALEKAFEGE